MLIVFVFVTYMLWHEGISGHKTNFMAPKLLHKDG